MDRPAHNRSTDDDIAIIGIGGIYPGSTSFTEFTQQLTVQASWFRGIPENHLPSEAIRSRYGAFIDDVSMFDNELFGILPVEAQYMDPRQRLLLMSCFHTLEDACYTPSQLSGRRVNVYVAAEGSPYAGILARAPMSPYVAPGISNWALPNRISHHFKFTGKSLLLDAGCSGSLVAMHEAMEALRSDEADYALIGAVSLMFGDAAAGAYLGQESLGILADHTTCTPFQRDAKGFLPAEACITVLLKRRNKAEQDGDYIHALLIGAAVNHSAGSGSFTAPSASAQASAMVAATRAARIDPFSITYIEAHGVSSPLADAEEAKAYLLADAMLRREFPGAPARPCKISSIKPNVGHANCVSGLMSLTRILAAFDAETKLGIKDFSELNDQIRLTGSRFHIDGRDEAWPAPDDGSPRRAAINNFSAGGANAFLVLEHYRSDTGPADTPAGSRFYLALSVPHPEQFTAYAARVADWLEAQPGLSPAQVEYLFACRKQGFMHRRVFRYAGLAELRDKLAKFVASDGQKGFYFEGSPERDRPVRELFRRYKELSGFLLEQDGEEHKGLQFDLWARGFDDAIAGYFSNAVFPKHPLPLYPFRLRPFWALPPTSATAASAAPQPAALRAGPGPNAGTLAGRVGAKLAALFGDVSKIDPERIDQRRPFADYHIDSLLIVALNAALAPVYPGVSATLFFECATLEQVALRLARDHPAESADWTGAPDGAPQSGGPASTTALMAPPAGREPVAVIGLAGRYPGASTLEEFWQRIANGEDCISEIPDARWPMEGFYDARAQESIEVGGQLRSYSKWGGFLDHIDEFDALLFKISPWEAVLLDPQERLFLQTCWHLMEDAGYTRESLRCAQDRNVAVFVGITKTGYELHGPALWAQGDNVLPRTSFSSVANRVSFVFDLTGLSMAVDTMCSSSLTAIHLACEHVLAGGSGMAIAGGVNLYLHPSNYLAMSGAKMLSPHGRCSSFGAAADGIVPGEGVGAVLLKPLSRAEADRDRIHGLILASQVNHGGATNGYTVPNPAAQAELVAATMARAGIAPDTVSYVEAHGTGTALGDPIELAGLRQAFAASSAGALPNGSCAIGSVKSNIGHLEAAAGVAGLTKVLLQMQHGQLAPTLHAQPANPAISFAGTPFRLQSTLAPWVSPAGVPRRAALSSFGAGGSNAHIIVEQYAGSAERAGPPRPCGECIVLSAASEAQLREQAIALLDWIGRQAPAEIVLQDLAFTLQVGREAMSERLAIVAMEPGQLRDKLDAFLAGVAPIERVYRDTVRPRHEQRYIMVDEKAAQRAMARFAQDGDYLPLLRLWLAGRMIDWSQAHAGSAPARIGLPLYPFARERHALPALRVPAAVPAAASQLSDAARDVTFLVPLWQTLAPRGRATAHRGVHHVIMLSEGEGAPPAGLPPAVQCHALAPCADGALAEWYGRICAQLTTVVRQCPTGEDSLIQLVVAAAEDQPASCALGLAGMLKCAALEVPGLRCQTVHLEADFKREDLAQCLLEVAGQAGYTEFRAGLGRLHYRSLAPAPRAAAQPAHPPLRPGAAYLVTGGLGGLGEVTARAFAAWAPGATLVLAGRSKQDEAGLARLEALRTLGVDVVYESVDVADRAQVAGMLARLANRGLVLKGIVHGAGQLRDGLIANKCEAQSRAVLAAKVDGTIALDLATRAMPLDFFVCYSSLAAELGNAGQADYCAANGFMDHYMRHRAGLVAQGLRHGASQSINWPLWESGGMRAGAGAVEAMRREAGMLPLSSADGARALGEVIASGWGQVAVICRAAQTAPGPVTTPAVSARPAVVEADVGALVAGIVCASLGLKTGQLDGAMPFSHVGMDSVSAATITGRLRAHFPDLPATLLFQYQTLDELTAWLAERWPAPTAPTAPTAQAREARAADAAEPIAVVAYTGRFPCADDVTQFWANLVAGRDAVSTVPERRLPTWGAPLPTLHDGIPVCQWGGFIEGAFDFDAAFFGIAPAEAQLMEPQERLMLESVWHLLESAGHTRAWRKHRYDNRIGVYVGASHSQYQLLGANEPLAALASVNGNGSIANRTSYHFGLEGPSIAVDTMCSSALTALALACRDLRLGECGAAVVGAVNLSLHRSKFLGLSLARLIASTSESRSFGAGDGFIPSEAVASVLLKTQSAAERDGDPIHGLLRAVQIGHDGSSAGYTTPSVKAQIRLFEAALDSAGLAPAAVGVIEAAANGAPLLDAVEFEALGQVFAARGDSPPCVVGSVKSLLGHAEAASGLVQLIKVLLQLRHGCLIPVHPPARPNPDIDWSAVPLICPREVLAWEAGTRPRVALINSIGAGGANGCLLLEEYRGAAPAANEGGQAGEEQVFVVSASTQAQLRELLAALRGHLALHPDIALGDLAYTLQLRREALGARFACMAGAQDELLARIDRFLEHGGGSCAIAGDGASQRLAAAWLEGRTVDWTALHGPAQRKLVALPAYPFARESRVLGMGAAQVPPDRAAMSDEQYITAIVARLCGGSEPAPAGATLDQLGISSISMLTLRHQIESHFRMPLEPRLFDRYQPLAEFTAAVIGAAHAGEQGCQRKDAPLHPVVLSNPADAALPFALTDMQEAMWAGRRLKIGGDWVGCHVYCEFAANDLDAYRLNLAWQTLLDYHPMLRAQVLPGGRQRVRAAGTFYKLRQFDLRGTGAEPCARVLDELRAGMSHRVYTVDDQHLFDIAVAALPGGTSRVFLSIDESLVDAVSINILLSQWQALYRDPALSLPPQRVSFRDFVEAVRVFEQGTRFQALLAQTLEHYQDMAPGPQLPRAGQGSGGFARTQFTHRLPAGRWRLLRETARGWRVSPTALMLGLFAETLRSRSAAPDFTLSLTYLNRPPLHPDIQAIVGPFMSTQLLTCTPAPTLRAVLTETEARLGLAMGASTVSGIRVLRELKRRKRIDPHLTLPVVFTSMLNIGQLGAQPEAPADSMLVPVYKATQTPQVYLDCQLLEREGDLHLVWDAATGAYEDGLIDDLFGRYCALVEHCASAGPECDIALAPAVPAAVPAPAACTGGTARLTLTPDPEARLAPFPLTIQQQAYGFARSQFLAGNSDSCQFYCEFDIRDADVHRLQEAWNRVMERHPTLTTRFLAGGNQQIMAQAPAYRIETSDLRACGAAGRDAILERDRAEMMANNTPLSGWPFFRIRAVTLDVRLTRVQFAIDMIVADGASIQMLLEQWFDWYREPALRMVPLDLCFRDYVVAIEAYKGSEPYQEDMHYWQAKFAGCRGSPLLPRHSPAGKPARKRLTARFAEWSRLESHAALHGLSSRAVLVAAYLEVLAGAAGNQAFEVVVPGWHRQPAHPRIDEVAGDFTTMCWVANPPGDLPFRERAARCDTELRNDLLHATVNGVSVLRRVRDAAGKMLSYQVVFSEPQRAANDTPDEDITIAYMASKTGGVDLDNITDIVGDTALLHWDYASGVVDEELLERLFGRYQLILAGLAAGSDAWNALQHGPGLDRVNG